MAKGAFDDNAIRELAKRHDLSEERLREVVLEAKYAQVAQKYLALEEAEVVAEARDPVCGMTVRTDSRHRAEHAGQTYYFCCSGCRERFVADPASFL